MAARSAAESASVSPVTVAAPRASRVPLASTRRARPTALTMASAFPAARVWRWARASATQGGVARLAACASAPASGNGRHALLGTRRMPPEQYLCMHGRMAGPLAPNALARMAATAAACARTAWLLQMASTAPAASVLCPTGTDHPLQAGVVGAVCSHRGVCGADGTCRCHKGASGTDCSRVACSEPDCSHRGVCVPAEGANGLIGPSLPPPVCKCNATYYGDGCEYKRCDHECGEAEGRGQCAKRSGTCACKLGWKGEACEVRACEGGCGEAEGRGACKPVAGSASLSSCVCTDAWFGERCELRRCPKPPRRAATTLPGPLTWAPSFGKTQLPEPAPSPESNLECSGRGDCQQGVCICVPGFAGGACELPACPNDCSHRGTCVREGELPSAGGAGLLGLGSLVEGGGGRRGAAGGARCVCDVSYTCRLHRTRVPQQLLGRWPLLHLARLQVRLPGGIQRSRLQRQVVRLALPRAARPLHPRQVPLRGRVERRRVRPAELPCGLLRPRPVHLWRLRVRGWLVWRRLRAPGVRRKGRARGRWRRRLRRERRSRELFRWQVLLRGRLLRSSLPRDVRRRRQRRQQRRIAVLWTWPLHKQQLNSAAREPASCFPRLQALNLQAQGRLSWPAVGRDFLWYPAEVVRVRARVRRERVRGADVLDGLQRPWALQGWHLRVRPRLCWARLRRDHRAELARLRHRLRAPLRHAVRPRQRQRQPRPLIQRWHRRRHGSRVRCSSARAGQRRGCWSRLLRSMP